MEVVVEELAAVSVPSGPYVGGEAQVKSDCVGVDVAGRWAEGWLGAARRGSCCHVHVHVHGRADLKS